MNEKEGLTSQIWRFFKPVAKVAAFFQFFGTANAQVDCFSVNGNQLYSLHCYRTGEYSHLLTLINKTCTNVLEGAYQYCPPASSNDYVIQGFGTGYFGGVICNLRHKLSETSGCVINIVKNNTANGFGSDIDLLAVFGICFGSLLIGMTLTMTGFSTIPCIINKIKARSLQSANERSRLINEDRSATAPNELSVIVYQ